MKKEQKNPFANPDGTPKEGQWKQYYDFEQAKRQEKIDKMTPEERKRYREGMERFFERMQS